MFFNIKQSHIIGKPVATLLSVFLIFWCLFDIFYRVMATKVYIIMCGLGEATLLHGWPTLKYTLLHSICIQLCGNWRNSLECLQTLLALDSSIFF